MDTLIIPISILAVAGIASAVWLFLEKKRLSGKLDDVSGKLDDVSGKLDDAKREKKNILGSRKKALWLLYLSEVSLQASVSILHSERVRFTRLKTICQENLGEYSEFRDKIQETSKRRLVTKGMGVALGFVPGLGLIQVLSDLIDIGTDVEDASEWIQTTEEVLGKFSGSGGVEFSDISTDGEIPIALTQDKQSVFKEAFEQNIGSYLETLNASNLDSCVNDAIQNMDDSESIKSMTEDERDDAIAEILEKVKDYVTESYDDYNQTHEEQSEKNAARSEIG